MAVEKRCSVELFLLLMLSSVQGTRDVLTERCEDRYGADLNENFALNKVASQSSTANGGDAARAVDGNRNPYFLNGSCSETEAGGTWRLDLTQDVYVTSVTITTTADDYYWRDVNYFHITLSNADPKSWSCSTGILVNNGGTSTYVCEKVANARYVEIRINGNQKLSLCEVEVHGRRLGFYENEVNYASLQAAKQSSTYSDSIAQRGVDGIRTTFMQGSGASCIHTDGITSVRWWNVDLGNLVDIYAVVITNRGDDNTPPRLDDFEIRVGENWHPSKNPSCAGRLEVPHAETRPIFCSRPMRGDNVGVVQKMLATNLQFCELSVHGREVGTIIANEPVCLTPKPLGMEDFTILDSQLTASSFSENNAVTKSRLNTEAPGAWSANRASDPKPWMQVGFLWLTAVTEVLTQGRHASNQWVTSFEISSSDDFVRYESYNYDPHTKVFPGNSDADTIVRHRLQPVRVVRIIRIHIVSYNFFPSMRVEFVGCYYKDKGFPLPRALGMQSKAITDTLISSSTSYGGHAAFDDTHSRLMGSGAWIAHYNDLDPWIQVNFVLTATVTEIVTQGRTEANHFTKNYKIAFSQEDNNFQFYVENGQEKLFPGNTDSHTVVRNALSPAIRAQFIRIYPKDYSTHQLLRLEFVGYYKDEKPEPLGLEDSRIQDVQLRASTEGGIWTSRDGRLHGEWAWSATVSDRSQWFQVDFWRLVKVTAILTQGLQKTNPEYVSSYYVSYSLNAAGFTEFSPYGTRKIHYANRNAHGVVWNDILPTIVARAIRIEPHDWYFWITLRVEVVGYYVTSEASCYARPLGMESGGISDLQIIASSFENSNTLPGGARLNFRSPGNHRYAWLPSTNDPSPWLQVEFYQIAHIVEIQTQGRTAHQMFFNYTVSYGSNGVDFQLYEQNDTIKVFQGNTDHETIVRRSLWPVLITRFIRITAISCATSCAVRAEFIGSYEVAHGPELIDPAYVEFDNTLTASSFAQQNRKPHYGIVSNHFDAKAWSPVRKEKGEYIQVDLLQLTAISGVGFRLAGDKLEDHYTKLIMRYGDTEESLTELLRDNNGNMTLLDTRECYKAFEKILLARFVRLAIDHWKTRPDFRFQLYGTTVYSEATAGVETGSIKDNQMKSSSHPNDPYQAHEARLNGPRAWCGNPLQKRLYLQIEFLWNFEVHAVASQGKTVGIMEYVTLYKLSSTMDGIAWNSYKEDQLIKIFTGNGNCPRCVRKNPVYPFVARALRFHPTEWKDTPCMRVEVYGVYKGILRIHARSGVVRGLHDTVVTRKCSIKLNGKEVSKKKQGYNIVVVNTETGALISSNAAELSSDVNGLIKSIPDDSIVVVATQNVTQRPPDDTLYLLESLGAIRLRYSITSEHLMFLLVGFKGKTSVNWIQEKLGTFKDDNIRIAVPIKLNKKEMRPAINELFVNSNNNTNEADISLSGDNAYVFRNMTGRCGENNTDCEMGLSLAMWMKQDQWDYPVKKESAPTSERIALQYYSQGYNYIVSRDLKNWDDAHRYCLSIGANLPVIHDAHTRSYLNALVARLQLKSSSFYLGLRPSPRTMKFTEWIDGSPMVVTNWWISQPDYYVPNGCAYAVPTGVDDYRCDISRAVICQQRIEALLNDDLFPLGMESNSISDDSITVSDEHDVVATPGRFGRLNRDGFPWCMSTTSEIEPFIEVKFHRPTKVCGVATQGRGFDNTYIKYPKAFWVQLRNDSVSNWTTLEHYGKRKIFHGNYDHWHVVINRFPQIEIAQIVRMNINAYYGNHLCMGIELFGCEKVGDKNVQKVDSTFPHLPGSITVEDTPKNCLDVLMRGKTSDGVYMIDPDGRGAFPAYCDQTTDDGGWTVFQRRFDGSVSFDRTWEDYKDGFGDVFGEHWLGLEYMLRITHASVCDMRVDLKKWDNSRHQTVFHNFSIADEARFYEMHYGQHVGTGNDAMNNQNHERFHTKDNNVGTSPTYFGGGWWYDGTINLVSLNGNYKQNEFSYIGIFWYPFSDYWSLQTTKMMLRDGVSPTGSSLGLKNYAIQDYQMSASYSSSSWPPRYARLDHSQYWWIPNPGSQPTRYLQVNYFSPRRITHISTQGSDYDFVSKLHVKFMNIDGTWMDYKEHGKKKIFEANNHYSNTQGDAVISNCLKEPVSSTRIRVFPVECVSSCSLRMELYACDDSCSAPVGIQSGFPLERIFASSTTSSLTLENLRLFSSGEPWRPTHQLPVEYIEVKFVELFKVTSIATQGGTFGTSKLNCFLTTFFLMYANEQHKWVNYGTTTQPPKVLFGNKNTRSIVRNKFESPFLAYSLRLVGLKWYNVMCLKLEVYGCHPDNPSFIVYTDSAMPGKEVQIRGQYRYCQACECPGCLKSVCIRVFGKTHLVAAYFGYDCLYHEFEITVSASVVPGLHRVHLVESEFGNCHENTEGSSERTVGNIEVKKDPSNCLELLLSGNTESGKYFIDPDGQGSFEVYCEQSLYGGGWTVFQRRASDAEDFERNWNEYKTGFGDIERDVWLGNEYIHRLTNHKQEVLLELTGMEDKAFVLHKLFQVSDEADRYRLHVAEYETSPAGNCLEDFNGAKFSTIDSDNDNHNIKHCAKRHGFGFWFNSCASCKLNGVPAVSGDYSLKYPRWTGQKFLKEIEMKVRDRKSVFCNDHYCYYVLKTWQNWFGADRECRRFNSDLVSIRNAKENEWIINEILLVLGIKKIHIGLRNETWSDGGTFDFHKFSSDVQPNLCPILSQDGHWQFQDCDLKSRILCKRAKWCFKERCHVIGDDELPYSASVKYCDDIGYKLSKIRNKEESEYLRMINHASTDDKSWLVMYFGLRLDSQTPLWYDGSRVRYTDWEEGEPNESHKFCPKVWSDGWRDGECVEAWGANPLCEKIYKEHPLDCLDLLMSGVTTSGIYTVDPDGLGPLQVYCDQETFGGGWTLLLRRVDSSVNFDRTWIEYKEGFGDLEGNFWLGNEFNHRLTKMKQEVLFDLESVEGDNGFALHKTFQIGDENSRYNRIIEGYQTSNIGNANWHSNYVLFSTKDADNDTKPNIHCARKKGGGWWFSTCGNAHLTGSYTTTDDAKKLHWKTWESNKFINRAEMKIRSQSVVTCGGLLCYYLTNTKKTWSEGLRECRNFNADLVSILNVGQEEFIRTSVLGPQSIDEVHIGLRGASDYWTDGAPLTHNMLSSVLTDSTCGTLSKASAQWGVNNCDEEKRVLCMRAKHCHKGDCYFTPSSPLNVYDARTSCQKKGYKVVKISTVDEKEYLMKLIRESTSDSSFPPFHIGLVLSDDERAWPDGTMSRLDGWFWPQEPNNVAGELYTIMANNGYHDIPDSWQGQLVCEKAPIIRSCNEVKLRYDRSESGIYTYMINNQLTVPVYCELASTDGSWLVIQRRIYDKNAEGYKVSSWASYRDGFGKTESNFWLGNKYIHELTWKSPHRLKIAIYTDDFHIYEAIYEDFYLTSEESDFVIHFGAYSGNAGDALSRHRGMKFSTVDRDNSASSCEALHEGGWWFEDCLDSNLNGGFSEPINNDRYIFWRTINAKIVKTEMKVQPYEQGSQSRNAIQRKTTSLSLTSKQKWIEINVQTSSQQWTTHVLHPGPFITHVTVTWEENSYLRYYENGTLITEIPAMYPEPRGYPYTSLSVFLDLPYLWLHQMKLWNEGMTSLNAYSQYGSTAFTFDDEDDLTWTLNKTSDYAWKKRQSCSPSNETGPCGDHTYHKNTGTFMTTEASRPAVPMDKAVMESPALVGVHNCLSFWYHLYGRRIGSLNVYLTTNSSEENRLLIEVSGDRGNDWKRMQVDLNATGVFKVIIEANRGEGFQGDIAVDDISLTRELCDKEAETTYDFEGIYDHRWTFDSPEIQDDQEVYSAQKNYYSSSVPQIVPGVLENAVQLTSALSLATLSDDCYMGTCFPRYTLSLWLKYVELDQQYLFSFGSRFRIQQRKLSTPENHLFVKIHVFFRKCTFNIFAPPEIWAHVIFVAKDDNFTVYVNGLEVANTTSECDVVINGPWRRHNINVGMYYDRTNFAIDDFRLLFDALPEEDTLKNYKTITGYDQSVRLIANFPTVTWQDELSDDETDVYRLMTQFLGNKIMATLGERSNIKSVNVMKFMKDGPAAEVDIVYHDVSYMDILLLEESIFVNNTFDGLQVNAIEINSSSVASSGPANITAVPLNGTFVNVSWASMLPEDLHGVFQGYKILYKETGNSSHTQYTVNTKYGDYTTESLTGLKLLTNYTLRMLAFTLSGDGLLSDPITFLTPDGEVTDSPNITVTNVSSTSLYVNWTMLPISTDEYKLLVGYKMFYWKESEKSNTTLNMTISSNTSQMLFENLEKWTIYCFEIAGFTLAGSGPNDTQCARTFEDAPEEAPRDVVITQVTTSSIQVDWSPPPESAMSGILRYYNISYRVLNISESEVVDVIVPASTTTYTIQGLTGLLLCQINISAFTIASGPSYTITALTTEGVPLAAPNVSMVNISSTSLDMNWTILPWELHNGILLGYKAFMWNKTGGIPVTLSFSPKEFYRHFVDLSKFTTYCVEITAHTAVGDGPRSPTECTRTFEDAPEEAPRDVVITQVTTSSIQVDWSPPTESAMSGILRYYNISYRVLNISESEVVDMIVPASTTTYTIQGLTGLLLCQMNISAFTIASGPSYTITSLTTEGVPLAAPNVSMVNISSTSLDMNWTILPWELHNGILLGYKAFMWNKTGGIPVTLSFSPEEFYKHFVDLSKWTTYCVEITAYTVVGDGPRSSTECTRTFEDAPEETPSHFTAVDFNITAIKLEWEPPPAFSTPGIVRLYNFTYRNMNYSKENLTTFEPGPSVRSLTLENLHGLTLYEINITAITILPGPWSTLFILTEEGVPVIPPPNIMWQNTSSTSIRANWSPLPPHLCNGIIIGYRVYIWKQSEDPASAVNTSVTRDEQVKQIEDLEKWTIYCGQVAAFTRIGEGPRSHVECIRTFEDEPEISPSHLNGTNVTWTSFYLNWEAINSSFIPGVLRSYRVSYEIIDPDFNTFNHAYDGSFLVESHTTSVNLTGLIGLVNYKVTVTGVTVKDGPLVEINLKTKEGVPTSPPEEITPTDVTATTIAISWKDIFLPEKHGIVKGYRLTYQKSEARNKREVAKTLTFNADVHTAFLFKLVPYTNYSITLAGYTSTGVGVEEHFMLETKQAAPNVAPKGFYGTNFTGPTTIFVGWGSLTRSELQGRLVGYEVKYREFSVADEILENPAPEVVMVIRSETDGIQITGLSTYTTYKVSVSALSGGGNGVRSGILYVATCRCHKMLTTNYWNYQPYTNISGRNSDRGFFPHLLDMVTLSCCQYCLEHGTSYVDYFHDGLGNPPERDSDISVKRNLTLETDYSFPVYGYNGQASYMRYYGFAPIVDIVGTVFFTLKPDLSLTQGGVLLDSVISIVPFLLIAVVFAYIAGVIMWALEWGHNEEEFPSGFVKGAANGFWWAYVTMTTVGYGDKTARTIAGRVFAVIWVLTGLVICSLLIGTISSAFTTSTTPPDPASIIIYGSKVAALQDSAEHRLGLRRNALFNKENITYHTLDDLRKVLLSGTVDGILVDAYVADARRDLFSSSKFMLKKVIDLTSSYGVVMGTDAKKLRKCFNMFWKEHSAARSSFISNHSNPIKVTDLSAKDLVGDAYNPQTALYQISLYSCALALCVLSLCGCIYEIIRRRKKSLKVHVEASAELPVSASDLRSQTTSFAETLIQNIVELRRKQKNDILALLKLQRRRKHKEHGGED